MLLVAMVLLTVILLLWVGGKYGHMLHIHGKSNQDNFFFFFQILGFAKSNWGVNPIFGKIFVKNLSF